VTREVHLTTPTSDGWRLRLFYYPAATKKQAETPVIICHGLAGNRLSVDFGEYESEEWNKYSLAAYLSRGGIEKDLSFDVWVVELRGRGDPPTFSPNEHPEKYKWCVDDYIDKDIPTIIRYIQNQYHKDKKPVYWIGKSMGGMIAYAYGETPAGRRNLKGVVTLGSPTRFKQKPLLLNILTRLCPRRLSIPFNAAEILRELPELRDRFIELGASKGNIDPNILEVYIDKGMDNTISSRVLNHFSIFFRHHTFCRYPSYPWFYDILDKIPYLPNVFKPYSYTENLSNFISPLLAMGGGADTVAPLSDIQYTTSRVGSSDVTMIILSRDNGYRTDYGHIDLTLGLHVREEVYPIIYDWLTRREV